MPKLPTGAELGSPDKPRIAGAVGQYDIGGDATAKARATVGLGREVTQLGVQLSENQRYNELLAQREGEQRAQEIARESEQTKLMVAREQARLDNINIEDAINRAKIKAVELAIGDDGYSKKHGKNGMGKQFFEDYSARFDNEVEKIRQELDPRIHGELDRHMVPVMGQFRGGILQHSEQQANRFAAQTAENTIAVESNAAKAAGMRGDQVAFDASMARIKYTINTEAERQGWNADTVARTLKDTESAIHLNIVDSLLNNHQNYKQASAYYAKHKDKIDREIGEKIEGNLVRAKKAIDAENEKIINERRQTFLSDLAIKVHRGEAGYGEIERAYNNFQRGNKVNGITPAERTALTLWKDSARDKQAEEAVKENAMIERASGALRGEYTVDFRNKFDKDSINTYFEKSFAFNLPNMTPEQASESIAWFSGQTGIIPETVKGHIRGGLRSGDAERRVQVADLLDRIKTKNPQVVDDFAAEDVALGNHIITYARAGMPADKAVKLATEAQAVPKAERDAREERYKTDKATKNNATYLSNQVATGFNLFSPNMPSKVPDAMSGEFEAIARTEFVRTGDLEVSQKTALENLKKVWGITNVDGKPRWMKYAPEVMYRVPGHEGGAWIREQLQTEVKKGALMAPGTEFTLAADSLTAREKRPSYVILIGREGRLEPMIGSDNLPVRFRPDFNSSPAGEKNRQAADKAKTEREQILEREKAKANYPNVRPAWTPGRTSEGRIEPKVTE